MNTKIVSISLALLSILLCTTGYFWSINQTDNTAFSEKEIDQSPRQPNQPERTHLVEIAKTDDTISSEDLVLGYSIGDIERLPPGLLVLDEGRPEYHEITQHYKTTLAAAHAGSAVAAYSLHSLIRDCDLHDAVHANSSNFFAEIELELNNLLSLQQIYEANYRLILDKAKQCSPLYDMVNRDETKNDRVKKIDVNTNWLSIAADGGYAPAILATQDLLILRREGKIDDLLAETALTLDPIAISKIAKYYKSPVPFKEQAKADAWNLVACEFQTSCRADIFVKQIQWAYAPGTADIIIAEATRIEHQLHSGSLKDYDFSTPLIEADPNCKPCDAVARTPTYQPRGN
tara:strand:- start:98 stop:1135 length:1038 start_codon:yes stop_codon:yes gene_type:complete